MATFDTLPAELRQCVFDHVFRGSSAKIYIGQPKSVEYRRRRRGRRLDLTTTTHHHALLVCRRWYAEGLNPYYRSLKLFIYNATTAATAPALSGLNKYFRDHIIHVWLSWRHRPPRMHRFGRLQSITCTPSRRYLHLLDWSTPTTVSTYQVLAQSMPQWHSLRDRVEATLEYSRVKALQRCAPQVLLKQNLCFLVRCTLHSSYRYHQHALDLVRILFMLTVTDRSC